MHTQRFYKQSFSSQSFPNQNFFIQNFYATSFYLKNLCVKFSHHSFSQSFIKPRAKRFKKPQAKPQAKQAGFSLLEVLVALLVFSFAALGMMALYLRAGQTTHHAATYAHMASLIAAQNEAVRLMTDEQKRHYANLLSAVNQQAASDLSAYRAAASALKAQDCQASCAPNELVAAYAYQAAHTALAHDARFNAVFCADNPKQLCLIAAWGQTQAIISDTVRTDVQDGAGVACAFGDGRYHQGAQCIVVKSY
ncbi:hypothetical protein B0181_08950 [Moraxella caviae]|uniref:Tfp pilus assembly protein PilV n=1 Tax=Moraxella caviae TaxID=34060 RepID=A0A1S9ZYN1_9GAMM|nr:hypothetical protein B0181_08950 [Moraxella caviae]